MPSLGRGARDGNSEPIELACSVGDKDDLDSCLDCQEPIERGRQHPFRRLYCTSCWQTWHDGWHKTLGMDEPLSLPQRYLGRAVHDFAGADVHIFQVGLGTYATFLQPNVRWLRILLQASTWLESEPLRGIGVDPLEESVGPLEELAVNEVGASVLLAALGKDGIQQSLFCLPRGARQHIRDLMVEHNEETWRRTDVDGSLAYLENMSSMGAPHPDFEYNAARVRRMARVGADFPLLEERKVPCHTFEGVLALHNARACEVLVVDAEGADCAILRNVIAACSTGRVPWPRVIRFEIGPRGGAREEEDEQMLCDLQREGYVLIDHSGDATLVHRQAMQACPALAMWADRKFTLRCYVCVWWTRPSSPSFPRDVGEGSSQWRGTAGDREARLRRGWGRWPGSTWCCAQCVESPQAVLAEAQGRPKRQRTSEEQRAAKQ